MDLDSSNQMEEQIWTLIASVEELTRQNEELRQKSNNAPPRIKNREQQSNKYENSRRKDHSNGIECPIRMEEEFQNMKKQMDELNNAMKGKGQRNLDWFDGSKDSLDHIESFKSLMNL